MSDDTSRIEEINEKLLKVITLLEQEITILQEIARNTAK